MNIFIIYPTQLFENNDYLRKMDKIFIIEEPFYFTHKKFHKQKLLFHRASMKYYYDKLKSKYKNVYYINFNKLDYKSIFKEANINIHLFDPIDKPILRKLEGFNITIYDTPAFLETRDDLEDYRNNHTNKRNYYHDNFYKYQRRRLDLLMKPEEREKWSFDKENRNPFDKSYKEPEIITYKNKYIDEAKVYIYKYFKNNFGLIDDIYYPITHEEAKVHLKEFIKLKLLTFGKYQDGISSNIIFGSHSVLSPLINIGLITPDIIITEIMDIYYKNKELLITVEAFIRQLIGWRSYVRFIYHYHGDEMMEMYKLNHINNLPESWYSAYKKDRIEIINDMIMKVEKYAYLHHIERLMIMGNIGLLLQINPKDLYDWFMICFIDSYEWVMVPNVFGMSQYSLTTISMMTRPYISSSNYINKMSNYKKQDWFNKWDALYWYFIYTHKQLLTKIYATAIQVKYLNNMNSEKLHNYIIQAKKMI